MKETTVVRLEERHLPSVAELERLCFSEPWSERSLALLLAEGNLGLAVADGDRVLAYVGMTTVLDEGSVTNVATHPEARRRGYGRALIRALLEIAREMGLTQIFLEVRESNLAARALYESAGFTVCGIRRGFYRHPTESALQMVWMAQAEPSEDGEKERT